MDADYVVATILVVFVVGCITVWTYMSDGPGVLDPSAPVADNRPKPWGNVDDGPLQAWTAAEREAFGINETEAFIKRVDRELATPLERTMMATAEDIAAAAAVPPPIIGKPGPHVWEQTDNGFRMVQAS